MKSQFVESVKRLYKADLIDEPKIIDMVNKKKITNEEKEYILKKD